MHLNSKHSLWVAALASLVVMRASLSPADSLVTTDGDMLFGSVTKTAAGYTVQTSDGPVEIAADRVRKVLYDHPQENSIPDAPVAAPLPPPPRRPLKAPGCSRIFCSRERPHFLPGNSPMRAMRSPMR